MEKIEIMSTLGRLEEFKESTIWKDITNELLSWKEGFNLEMGSIVENAAEANPSTASVLLHMGDLNGRVKAVDYMLGIIDMFIDIKTADFKEDKDES